MIHVEQRQLLTHPGFAFAPRVHATADGGDMLPEVEIEAFDERGVNLPTARRYHPIDGPLSTEHDAVVHAD